ncbi:MAG: hypothetical protein QXR39_09360 [Candidatus Methanomethylicia archaeon]
MPKTTVSNNYGTMNLAKSALQCVGSISTDYATYGYDTGDYAWLDTGWTIENKKLLVIYRPSNPDYYVEIARAENLVFEDVFDPNTGEYLGRKVIRYGWNTLGTLPPNATLYYSFNTNIGFVGSSLSYYFLVYKAYIPELDIDGIIFNNRNFYTNLEANLLLIGIYSDLGTGIYRVSRALNPYLDPLYLPGNALYCTAEDLTVLNVENNYYFKIFGSPIALPGDGTESSTIHQCELLPDTLFITDIELNDDILSYLETFTGEGAMPIEVKLELS